MTLSVGQMTYNNLAIGPGGVVQLVDVDGLTGLPGNRSGDVGRPNTSGMLGGYDFMGTRSITMDLQATATGGNNMPVNLGLLRAAMLMDQVATGGVNPTSSQILTYNFGEGVGGVGVNRRVACRPRKVDSKVDVQFAGGGFATGLAIISVLMETIDPLIYDAVTQAANVGLTVATGGLVFPVTFPATFGSQSGGLIFATNSGSIAGPAYMTITGPCQNPRVEQQTTGVTLQFNFTMGASDTLVIDTYAGTAVLNGTASRLNAIAPGSFITQFNLPPGTNEVGFYSSDATATGATLTMEWASTWA